MGANMFSRAIWLLPMMQLVNDIRAQDKFMMSRVRNPSTNVAIPICYRQFSVFLYSIGIQKVWLRFKTESEPSYRKKY